MNIYDQVLLTLQVDNHDMIRLMHLVLIICMLISILTVLSIRTAVFSLTVIYPNVVLTVAFIPTVVYILTVDYSLSNCSQQHNSHSYFHVTFISSYPAVRVQIYAYVKMLRNNKLTHYLLERKAIAASLQLHEERTTALVKGSVA